MTNVTASKEDYLFVNTNGADKIWMCLCSHAQSISAFVVWYLENSV